MNFVWLFSYKFRHTAIHFELWENRKRFATFFMIKSTFWSTILDHVVFSMNEIIAGLIFILSTADALYCICTRENMWHDRMSCFEHDMLSFSNEHFRKISEIRAGREKALLSVFMAVEEALVLICTWIFQCLPTALTMDIMYWSQPFFNWSRESNKKVLTFSFTCCSIAILPYWTGK